MLMQKSLPVVAFFPTTSEILSRGSTSCEHCGKCFSNSAACRMHIVKLHGIVSTEGEERLKNKSGRNDVVRQYYCSAFDCKKVFISMKKLRQHFQKCHMERRLICPSCNARRFVLQRDLDYHLRATCFASSNITAFKGNDDPQSSLQATTSNAFSHVQIRDLSIPMNNEDMVNLGQSSKINNRVISQISNERVSEEQKVESGIISFSGLPPGKSAIIIMDTSDVPEFLKSMNVGAHSQRTVCVQTESCAQPVSISTSVHNSTPPPVYQMPFQLALPTPESCFAARQDSHCQAAPFNQPTRADFGTQIEEFLDTPQVRHAETSMVCLEDWRSIETQTMPLWSEGERAAYWDETFGSAENQNQTYG